MPYLSKDTTARIRKELKAAFPGWKFSVTKNHAQACIQILSGPVDFWTEYEGVNHFYVEEHWSHLPEAMKALQHIVEIATDEQKEVYTSTDYGVVPNHYVSVTIGRWDKPYEVTA